MLSLLKLFTPMKNNKGQGMVGGLYYRIIAVVVIAA